MPTATYIVVYATPGAGFTADPPLQRYPEATVTFTPDETEGSTFLYLWDFGDGNTSAQQNPVHTYDRHGEYDVTLTVSNVECSMSRTQKVDILPALPVAAFDEVIPGCAPYTVTFTNNSQHADNYRWAFGDGAMSNEENPVYTYQTSGTFKIVLTAYGADGLSAEHTSFVTVLPTPVAGLNAAPAYVYVNDQHVATFNLSTHGHTYLWDFGDGNTSNEYEPVHVYMETGIFDISLEVWSEDGCYDKYTKWEAVEVDQAGMVVYPSGFRPGNEPTGGYVDQNASEYERNRVFMPGISDKIDNYHLMIYNRWGEMLFESRDINIGWDGFVRGVKAKQDVYIWKVTGRYTNGEPFVMAGDITLLR